MTCDEATLDLGAYVVGSLDQRERTDLENHLHRCPSCRDQLADIAGLPGLLGKLSLADVVVEPVAPPPELFERLAARARLDEAAARRHPARRWLGAVAAAVVLGGGVVVGVSATHHTSHPASSFSATSSGVRMNVVLTSQRAGTGLAVTVSGLPFQEHCRLVAVGRDGSRDLAGSWTATYQGDARVTGSTSIARSNLSQLVLLGRGGRQLVTVPV